MREDPVDRITEEVIRAFEPLSDWLLLESIAVPEDLDDPDEEIDLWVVGAEAHALDAEAAQSIVLRATASIPIGAVVNSDGHELSRLLREELLFSPGFRQARLTAHVAAAASHSRGIPTEEQARMN